MCRLLVSQYSSSVRQVVLAAYNLQDLSGAEFISVVICQLHIFPRQAACRLTTLTLTLSGHTFALFLGSTACVQAGQTDQLTPEQAEMKARVEALNSSSNTTIRRTPSGSFLPAGAITLSQGGSSLMPGGLAAFTNPRSVGQQQQQQQPKINVSNIIPQQANNMLQVPGFPWHCLEHRR